METEPISSMATLARTPVAGLPAMIAQMFEKPSNANLFMSQFQLFSLIGNQDFALEMQRSALKISTIYRIAGTDKPAIRLLALMGAGIQNTNTPLDYLIENSDIQLDLLYIVPDVPLPEPLPEHDVAIIAPGESDQSRPILERIAEITERWPRPLLNRPEHILRCSRDAIYQQLKDIPGLLIPPTLRIERADLLQVARSDRTAKELFGGTYPITLRPLVSHGGHGLARIENTAELATYLEAFDDKAFFVSFYIDYQSSDGFFRKARIALIDGTPYICHLAIGDHWIVHYGTAGMTDSASKRDIEARVMRDFDSDFAQRHRAALKLIAQTLKLDYVVLDCAETADGNLLLFEADNRSWVHATDPADIFPYKQAAMNKVFSAFRAMLFKASGKPCR
jgi:glutathione synthase/RimK-type ligase-like ATP-grasp enzyme